MFTNVDVAIQQLAGALVRAESNNHVPRVVLALERIATALEKIAKHDLERVFVQAAARSGLFNATCAKCKKPGEVVNNEGWCFSCFCGDSPK